MAIFLREDSEQAIKKDVKVPDKLVKKMQVVDKTLGEKYPQSQGAKRAKKIANGGEYNKKGKTNPHKDNGTYISFAELKRADHELRHCKNPKSLKFQLNGGQEMADFYHNELNRIRRSVKQPEIVKAVKQNSVNVEKPKTDDLKPIKINGGEIHINENKKVFLSETQLLMLNEYYTDQRLPFEEDEYGKKNTLDHFIDVMEKNGKYAELQPSNIKDIYTECLLPNLNKITQLWLRDDIDGDREIVGYIIEDFISDYTDTDNYIVDPQVDNSWEYIHNFSDFKDNYLTDKGKTLFDRYVNDVVRYRVNEYNMFDYVTNTNENGLIYIERVISLPKAEDTNFMIHNTVFNDKYTLFDYIDDNFDGLGDCWTWFPNGGENYNGTNFRHSEDFTLKAYVRPEDVLWFTTVELNSPFMIQEEREIRLRSGCYVQMVSIAMEDNKEYFFKRPFITRV